MLGFSGSNSFKINDFQIAFLACLNAYCYSVIYINNSFFDVL